MRASEQAKLLFPYLLPMIQRAVAGATGGGSATPGVGGAPSPHALSSVHHTGTITDAQAPQFLLTNGTRALTGHLSVSPSITIDGVDLDVHVGDPDAHHDRVTAFDGLQLLSGQQIGIKLAVNSGLETDTTFGLWVGAGDGIDVVGNVTSVDVTDIINTSYGIYEPTPNDIGINLATDSGMEFVSDALTMGTPGDLDINTFGLVSGDTHYHLIVSNSNVGIHGDPTEYILKSTPSGGLTLSNLDVTGNVDITDGGDLTVGANILFVDASQQTVGINRAPDPQFALDVNGPIRGTELVGKHAIQLDDVALLLHFDGGHPYETNYTGELNAIPMGQVPISAENVIFRPGKFYKAAVFGTARANLCQNPSFETNTTGWAIFNGAGGDLAVTRTNEDFYIGNWGAKLTWTTVNNSQFYYDSLGSTFGASAYSLGVWMRANIPCSVTLKIMRSNSPFTEYATKTVSVTEEWQFFTVSGTFAGAGIPMRLNILPLGTGNTLYVDAVQYELGETSSWYIDGSLGEGYAWNGTAHASTSTRAQTTLSYTLADMVYHRWTAMGWFCWPNAGSVGDQGVLYFSMSNVHWVSLYTVTGSLYAEVQRIGGTDYHPLINTPEPGRWYHIAVTGTRTPSAELNIYVDGVEVVNSAVGFGVPTAVSLGSSASGLRGNVMVDDFCVSRQYLSAERIAAIVESDAPVFATSSVFMFRATPKGLVWADEEGLWMRNTDGNEVLGAYGGESTKSWAGLTLAPGDIVFGDSNRGAYLLWDDSAGGIALGRTGASTSSLYADGNHIRIRSNATDRFLLTSAGVMEIKNSSGNGVFTFDASAGAEFTLPLTLGVNGGIYQGTGTFASPTTGLKLFRSSNIGKLSTYSGGLEQVTFDTDGILKAGAGNVQLDRNGIRITGIGTVISTSAEYVPANALTLMNSGEVSGWLSSSRYNSGVNHEVALASAPPQDTDQAELYLFATPTGLAHGAGTTFPFIWLRDSLSVVSRIDIEGQLIVLGHITGSPTTNLLRGVLALDINTFAPAVGAYAGKMEVTINGVTRYIPYYAS